MATGIFEDKGRMIRKQLYLAALILTVVWSGLAHADKTKSFNDDVSRAYAAYRSAANYLRTGNPGIAYLELSEASDAWGEIFKRYAKAAPQPYTNDKHFHHAISNIGKALKEGRDLAESGDAAGSLETIHPVREWLYELRNRNGVRLYADCVTELNQAMEPIFVHRKIVPNLDKEAVRARMVKEGRTYQGLLNDCHALAPASYTSDPEFIRLYASTKQSIASIFPAIESLQAQRVINVIRELRSFDRIIYFKFGG